MRPSPTREALALVRRSAPWHFVGSAALAVLAGAAPVAAAWLTKVLLDAVADRESWDILFPPLAALVSVAVLLGLTGPWGDYLGTELGRRAGRMAKQDLFASVGRLQGIGRFEDPRFLSQLRLAESAGGTSPASMARGVLGLARAAITVVGMVGALYVISPILTVAVVAGFAPVLAAEVSLNRRRVRMQWRADPHERREFFYASLLSEVQAAKEIRLFGLTQFFGARMMRERGAADALRRTVDRRELVLQGAASVLTAGIAGTALVWAISTAAKGSLSVGGVSLVIAAVAGLQAALAGSVASLSSLHHSAALFAHHVAVLATPADLDGPDAPDGPDGPHRPDAPDAPGDRAAVLPPLRQALVLEGVWFRYTDDSPWVLRDVNLTIPAGSSVGLVGHNGAGKSTLVKLLCRFYDPTRGRILWDGVDISDVPVEGLRDRLGAVFQDFMTYDLTAAENIGIGDLRHQDGSPALSAIQGNAALAGVARDLEALPRGYQTLLSRAFFDEIDEADDGGPDLGSHGTFLSGGQWQKVATARALMRSDRDVMILDEPSSGLDPTAERDLHQRLTQARRGRTNLLVSHRLGALRDADLIVALVAGTVVETGDHDALMDSDGVYAELFRAQASGYQLAGGQA